MLLEKITISISKCTKQTCYNNSEQHSSGCCLKFQYKDIFTIHLSSPPSYHPLLITLTPHTLVNQTGPSCHYIHQSIQISIFYKGSLQKKIKSVDFFPPPRAPPPPKVWKHILGEKIFLQFHPENDLPTHKNWIK